MFEGGARPLRSTSSGPRARRGAGGLEHFRRRLAIQPARRSGSTKLIHCPGLHCVGDSARWGVMESLSSLLPLIQLAITPVILISGMGALMITLTNRMARVVDRTRELAEAMPSATPDDWIHLDDQLQIMWGRALMLRRAVTSNGLSMLISCLMVVVIFGVAKFELNLGPLVLGLFVASILFLTASLVDFLRDIFVSLHAVKLQVDRARGKPATIPPWPSA